jgi:lysophospholipase L1-like esterase
MDRRRTTVASVLLLAAIGAAWRLSGPGSLVRAQSGFALQAGDRVLFYGDSITAQQLYTTLVETCVVTRFPDRNVRFIQAGWDGDRVTGSPDASIDLRLERDVISHRPTVVTLMLGMNDGGYRPFDPGLFEAYTHGYPQILAKVRQALPDVRFTLLQPSAYDDVTRPPRFIHGYNPVMVRYGQFVREVAEAQGATVADLNAPVIAALQRAESLDADLAQQILPDRIHPAPAGHLLLAAALLKAWNAPSLVTAVTIDAAARRAVRTENTVVSEIRSRGGLSWVQRDRALPVPLDQDEPALRLVLRASDVVEALNQEPLRVVGLPEASYTLRIDGERVASFTREALSDGLNLAVLPTPMSRQAQLVHELTTRRSRVQFARWRRVQVPLHRGPSPRLLAAMRRWEAREESLVRQQRAAAQPRVRRYELTPEHPALAARIR